MLVLHSIGGKYKLWQKQIRNERNEPTNFVLILNSRPPEMESPEAVPAMVSSDIGDALSSIRQHANAFLSKVSNSYSILPGNGKNMKYVQPENLT